MNPSDTENTAGVIGEEVRCVEYTLMIRRCSRCKRMFAPLTFDCSACASDSLEWVPSAGAGSIRSWRVVERAPIEGRGGLLPLTIAIVELDEGPWVYTCIEGEVPALRSRSVRVQFQPRPREDRFPVFAVDADADNALVRDARGSGSEAR